MGHISDRVYVAPKDIGGTLLVDMWPYGCFIYQLARVPVVSVRYFCLIKDVLCNFVWFTKNIKCTFTLFIYLCIYS